MKLRLSDKDRERLGGPEWIEFDGSMTTQEAEAIEEMGEDPYLIPRLVQPKAPTKAVRLMVWLALRRAGVEVPFADCHFDFMSLQSDVDPGKAPSAISGSRTRPASAATSTRGSTRSK